MDLCRATPPISETFNEGQLRDALEATRNAHCPDFILPDHRKSTVVTTMDYETAYGAQYGHRKLASHVTRLCHCNLRQHPCVLSEVQLSQACIGL